MTEALGGAGRGDRVEAPAAPANCAPTAPEPRAQPAAPVPARRSRRSARHLGRGIKAAKHSDDFAYCLARNSNVAFLFF